MQLPKYSKQEAIGHPYPIFTSLTEIISRSSSRYDTRSLLEQQTFTTLQRTHATTGIVPDVFRADCRIGHGGAGHVCDCVATRRACIIGYATCVSVCVRAFRISHSEAKRHVHRMRASSIVAQPMVARQCIVQGETEWRRENRAVISFNPHGCYAKCVCEWIRGCADQDQNPLRGRVFLLAKS